MGIDNLVLHGSCRVVTGMTCRFTIVVFRNDYTSAVRIEEKFRRIEAKSLRRIEGTLDTVCIDLTGLNVRKKDVPIVVSMVGIRIETDYPGRLPAVFMIEKQQLHTLGIA
jgi:hypothetical protein